MDDVFEWCIPSPFCRAQVFAELEMARMSRAEQDFRRAVMMRGGPEAGVERGVEQHAGGDTGKAEVEGEGQEEEDLSSIGKESSYLQSAEASPGIGISALASPVTGMAIAMRDTSSQDESLGESYSFAQGEGETMAFGEPDMDTGSQTSEGGGLLDASRAQLLRDDRTIDMSGSPCPAFVLQPAGGTADLVSPFLLVVALRLLMLVVLMLFDAFSPPCF